MSTPTNTDIWVVADLRSERFFGYTLNLLAQARELAQAVSGRAAVVVLESPSPAPAEQAGPPPDEAVARSLAHGADLVYRIADPLLAAPRADCFALALAAAVRQRAPRLVLCALTDFGRELAARAARLHDAGLIADCADLRWQAGGIVASCPSWGGEITAEITYADPDRTGFATVQPHIRAAVAFAGIPGVAERLPIDSLTPPPGLTLLSRETEPEGRRCLEDAETVVVGGGGLGSADGFHLLRELAVALGAEVGATRPPVAQHWVDEDRLIGQTGKTVRPRLLVSVGTSGAIQYTAGIAESETIVAVNRDAEAPIFALADIGVVADARTFLPLLTAKVKQTVMRGLADLIWDENEKDGAESFGDRIRKIREARDWTPAALAEATGQTPEFIARVERDEVAPPVAFLLRLAAALGVDPSTFLSREEKTHLRDQRAQAYIKRTQNYSYQNLTPEAAHDHLKAFLITIDPKQAHKPVAYKHEGEEFIFVMAGELELTLGSKAHHLHPGESIHFNSDTPHKLKSLSSVETRCLVVLYTL